MHGSGSKWDGKPEHWTIRLVDTINKVIERSCGHTVEAPDPNCAHCWRVGQKANWKKRNKTPGNSPEYLAWYRIVSRCGDEMAKRWQKFETFLADVGKRPTKNHRLVRLDPAKPFSKENVAWSLKMASLTDPHYRHQKKKTENVSALKRATGNLRSCGHSAAHPGANCEHCRLVDAKTRWAREARRVKSKVGTLLGSRKGG